MRVRRILGRLRRARDERGATIVIVAISMTVILSMGALTVDYGSLSLEKRRVQNAADASARVIARDCYLKKPTCTSAFGSTGAPSYVLSNAGGDAGGLVTQRTTKKVEVRVSKAVDYTFAPLLGQYSGAVDGTAQAAWDYVPTQAENFLPVGINVCSFMEMTSNNTTFPSTTQVLRSDMWTQTTLPATTSCTGPSGTVTNQVKGSMMFTGLLGLVDVIDLNACNYRVTLVSTLNGSLTNTLLPPLFCYSKIRALSPGDIITVPIYQTTGITTALLKVNLSAKIIGFAAFQIEAWRFDSLLDVLGLNLLGLNSSNAAQSANFGLCIALLCRAGVKGKFLRITDSKAATAYTKAGGLNIDLGIVKIRLEDPQL
jgi:Flp pilus assembly protein TadG